MCTEAPLQWRASALHRFASYLQALFCEVLAIPVNLGRLGNALAIWLGVQPADLFLYIFLPPMLLDEAVRIEYFIFKKVVQQTCRSAATYCSCNTVAWAASSSILHGPLVRHMIPRQARIGGTCIAAAQLSAR